LFTVYNRVVVGDAQPGQTQDINPQPNNLLSLCHHLLHSENLWMVVLWNQFSPVRRGPKTIEKRAFRFDQFRLMIWEAVQSMLKIIRMIPALRSHE
jgi:hypothetical protein